MNKRLQSDMDENKDTEAVSTKCIACNGTGIYQLPREVDGEPCIPCISCHGKRVVTIYETKGKEDCCGGDCGCHAT